MESKQPACSVFENPAGHEKRRAASDMASPTPSRKKSTRKTRRTNELFRIYHKTRDPGIRNQICEEHLSLVSVCAYKYAKKGVDYEDLYQEGCLGLLRAIDGFDPARGVEFRTYATYFVEGFIRQYFRDKAWICHVPRSVKDLALQIKRLSEDLGHEPTRQEIIDFCGVPDNKADEAIAASQLWSPICLYSDGEINYSIIHEASYDDNELESLPDRLTLQKASAETLSPMEASVVHMYYYDDLSQREIARKLGTYQMMISRLLEKSNRKLEAALSDGEERRVS